LHGLEHSSGHAPLGPDWEKSFLSGNNGQCVEARFVDGHVEIRNSNSPDAGSVRFTREEWERFGESYDGGQFRLPAVA
jgi:hypothetical protein